MGEADCELRSFRRCSKNLHGVYEEGQFFTVFVVFHGDNMHVNKESILFYNLQYKSSTITHISDHVP